MKSAAREFIRDLGVGPESLDAEQFTELFTAEMRRGLQGKDSSLGMIPTYLRCEGHIPKEGYAAAIDAGGTNFRTALVKLTDKGAKIEKFSQSPMPGTKGRVSWAEFISFAAERLSPLAEYTDRVGVCLSFPCHIDPDKDGTIQRLTKEVDIAGFQGRRVCAELLDALGGRFKKALLLNDTSAVLMSGLSAGASPAGLMGLINGTGTNVCCQLQVLDRGRMIVDVESGGFVPPGRGPIDRLLDENTAAPGIYVEEKMVSGAYLGELCRLSLISAGGWGVFSGASLEKLGGLELLSTPQADSFGAGAPLPFFAAGADEAAAREIVRAVFARAAKHIACTLVAASGFGGAEPKAPAAVSADGSVFRKSLLFRPALEQYLRTLAPGRAFSFIEMDDSTVIGSALAALIN